MLGSVAGAVVRDAHAPVLVRRDSAAPMVLRLDNGQAFSALVPLDGSPLAEAALAPAVQLVAAMSHSSSHASGGSVHLLRVVEPSLHHTTEQSLTARREHAERRRALRRELREAREYLDATATLLRERCADALGVSVSWSIGRGHEVAEAILRAAQAAHDATGSRTPHSPYGPDVIAMGTHGRGGLKRWLMGGITESVLHNTTVPMLIVRPRGLDVWTKPAVGESAPVATPRSASG
jgi:nucleotide-binding universal stress UspA family protein